MSDEKNASGKSGVDVTADDLLARLKQNYDGPSEIGRERDGGDKAHVDKLKIDDTVYRCAEENLRTSDAVSENDDSDLDVDELIDMYITKPRAEREARAALAKAEESAAQDDADASDELGNTHEYGELVDELAGIFEEPMLPSEKYDPLEEARVIEKTSYEPPVIEYVDTVAPIEDIAEDTTWDTAEETLEDTTDDIAEYIEEVAPMTDEKILTNDMDDDVKLAEDAVLVADDSLEGEENNAYDEVDDRTTAVFDISRVKQIAEADDTDLDSAIDEAFAESATEVFTPVSEEDVAADTEQVYGQDDTGEVDQTDLHIMLAFGMEEQLKQTVGEEEASRLEEDIIQRHEQTSQIQSVEQRIEYTTRDQNGEIMAQYEAKYKSVLIRIAAAVALLIGVFLIENFSVLGLTMPAFMRPTSYPVVYAMIDLQLVVLSSVLVYRQVIDGCLGLLKRKVIPETLTALMLTLSVIYSIAASITAPVEGFAMYNLPVVLTVVLALVYDFMTLKREMYSFNVVASRKKKFVITPVSDETESLEREVFSDYVPSDTQIIRVGKTDFVDGFYERSVGKKISKPIIGILLPVLLALSLVFLIVAIVGAGRVYGALTSGFLTIAFCAPLSLFAIYSYPFYKASKDAFDNDSAIIGETSLEEYSGSSIISFEDKEVFPSKGVKVTSIKVFGQNRIDEIIYNVASAFIKVGGPLADVFAQATQELGYSEDVELIEADDDGFAVTVDGELIYVGKESYMEKKDYDPPFDSEGRKQEHTPATGILYIAFGGQLAAKMYVQYTIDGEFESVLGQLYKTGMCVGIKSFDPNIDDMLLAKKIKAIKYPVKVIRAKNVEDIPHTFERCESGVVSKRSVKALLRTVALCEKVNSVIKTNLIIGILAMLIGAVVMIFVSALGGLSMPSMYVLLYQLFWLVAVVLISKFLV